MKSFDFADNAIEFQRAKQFIVLGKTDAFDAGNNHQLLEDKIQKRNKQKLDFAWGTLGWADNREFKLKGNLLYSEAGNTDEGISEQGRNPITIDHVRELREIHSELMPDDKIMERALNFDEVDFDIPEVFTEATLPKLRLSVFLEEGEGAIVYYQFNERDNLNDEDAAIEYIQCESTKDFGGERDRLTYHIPVIPKKLLDVVSEQNETFKQSDDPNPNSFIVKILTFKRKKFDPNSFLKDVASNLSKMAKEKAFDLAENVLYDKVGADKYRFMVFDPNVNKTYLHKKKIYPMGGDFFRVRTPEMIDNNAKTLFLIHGTFVNTNSSYLDVWRIYDGETQSFLQHLISSGKYEQIIALDHPTISVGAHHNVNYLKEQMDLYNVSFTKEVDVITTSRGALIAECISGDPDLANSMRLNKVMMFSAANGCGYFRVGSYLSKGLSAWKKSASGVVGKIILAIAETSVEFVLQLDGCRDMTPRNMGNSTLDVILSKRPNNRNTIYKNVVADWNKSLHDKFWAKLWRTPTDLVIKAALGWRHDWVIGCKSQELVPDHSRSKRVRQLDVRSIHGGYLNKEYIQNKRGKGLARGFNIHEEIEDYFA